MSDLAKLKKKAADLEQRRQFDRALAVYEEMLLAQEGSDDADVSLLNRVGDLRLRIGRPTEALDAYERAVDLYVERGFLNNAIALCNKILRQDPARADVHYRLGRISAEKGFRSDAKRHFLEYAGLMQVSGRLDEAFTALSQFADLSPDHTDVRLMLAEQLARHGRAEEAVAQLTTVLERFEAERRFAEADEVAERIRALDPTFAAPAHAEFDAAALDSHAPPSGRRSTPSRAANGMPDLVLIDPSETLAAARAAASEPGLQIETTEALHVPQDAAVEAPPADGFSAGAEVSDADGYGAGADPDGLTSGELVLDGFESTGLDSADTARESAAGAPAGGTAVEGLDQFEPTALGAETPAHEPIDADLTIEPAEEDTGRADLVAGSAGTTAGRDPHETGADDVGFELTAGEIAGSDEPAVADVSLDAVDAAFLSYQGEELVTDEPPAAVDLEAPFAGDDPDATSSDPLLEGLMDGEGADDGIAGAGFAGDELVIEQPHLEVALDLLDGDESQDPVPSRAAADASAAHSAPLRPADAAPRGDAALRFDAPDDAPSTADDSFISLGDLLRSEDGPRSTRMVTEEKAPTGDEQADFAEMLRKFKQGVAENVDDGDFESHHDLGVAYKEMGLLDEAVAAFQRALRGTPHRARTYEALGHCFLEREQYAVASGILQRALSEPGADDQQLVGVLYLLGRASEAMNQREEALSYYQRVFAVDIEFADVAERMESVVQVAR